MSSHLYSSLGLYVKKNQPPDQVPEFFRVWGKAGDGNVRVQQLGAKLVEVIPAFEPPLGPANYLQYIPAPRDVQGPFSDEEQLEIVQSLADPAVLHRLSPDAQDDQPLPTDFDLSQLTAKQVRVLLPKRKAIFTPIKTKVMSANQLEPYSHDKNYIEIRRTKGKTDV